MSFEVIIPVITAAAGAIGTYVTAVSKSKRDMESRYDATLQEKRIDAYSNLWKRMESLAKCVSSPNGSKKILKLI